MTTTNDQVRHISFLCHAGNHGDLCAGKCACNCHYNYTAFYDETADRNHEAVLIRMGFEIWYALQKHRQSAPGVTHDDLQDLAEHLVNTVSDAAFETAPSPDVKARMGASLMRMIDSGWSRAEFLAAAQEA